MADTFVHYVEARELLAERLGATPQEIAIWTWIGDEFNGKAADGINGYRDPNLHAGQPPRFHFEESWGKDFTYLPHLMDCYYRSDDLKVFEPQERYLTFERAVSRFSRFCSTEEARALIRNKALSGKLQSYHPRTGGTKGTRAWGDEEGFPPLEEGLFPNSEILEIEEECVGAAPRNKPAPISGYVQLGKLLEECWDLPFAELSHAQRHAIAEAFHAQWNTLTAQQRRIMAEQLDLQRDPANEAEQQRGWHEFLVGWEYWRTIKTLAPNEFVALRHCLDPRKAEGQRDLLPEGKRPSFGERLDDELRRITADPSISTKKRWPLRNWVAWAEGNGLQCPPFMHAHIEDRPAPSPSSVPGITPKAFIEKHSKCVKGGKPFLDRWFKGESRTKGERPPAFSYRIQRGSYDEAAMIAALKEQGLYSELGY